MIMTVTLNHLHVPLCPSASQAGTNYNTCSNNGMFKEMLNWAVFENKLLCWERKSLDYKIEGSIFWLIPL